MPPNPVAARTDRRRAAAGETQCASALACGRLPAGRTPWQPDREPAPDQCARGDVGCRAKAWAGIADKLRHLPDQPVFLSGCRQSPSCASYLARSSWCRLLKAKSAEARPNSARRGGGEGGRPASDQEGEKGPHFTPATCCRSARRRGSCGNSTPGAGGLCLNREQTSLGGRAVAGQGSSPRIGGSLWQRKLNIAWLPPEQVFLRVAQFPVSDFDETAGDGGVAVGEAVADAGDADRLEHPGPAARRGQSADGDRDDRLAQRGGGVPGPARRGRATWPTGSKCRCSTSCRRRRSPRTARGFIRSPASASHTALVAWWYGGVLQNLALITLPPANRAGEPQGTVAADGLGRRTGRLADRARRPGTWWPTRRRRRMGARPCARGWNSRSRSSRRCRLGSPGRLDGATRRAGRSRRRICCRRSFRPATSSNSWIGSGCAAWARSSRSICWACWSISPGCNLHYMGTSAVEQEVAEPRPHLHQRPPAQGAVRGA